MTIISAASVSPSILQAAQAAGDFGKISTALVGEIEATAAKLFSVAATAHLSTAKTDSTASGTPTLRQPDLARAHAGLGLTATEAQKMRPEAMLTLLMGLLQELLQETSTESVRSRLALLRAQGEAQKASFERLAEAYQRAEAHYDSSVEAANGSADEALRALSAAQEAAQRVSRLRAQLDGLSPTAPEYAAVQAKLQQAEAESAVLYTRAQDAITRSDQAATEMAAAMDEVARVRSEVDRQTALGPPALGAPSRKTNGASVTELLAKLNQITSESGLAKLQSDSKLAMEVMNERAAENKRLAEEQAAEEAKAAHMNKVMGCFAKVLGWLLAVVAVVYGAVGAIFTGGLTMVSAISLAVAVIGLIMAVVEEATKFSVIGQAIKPFVEHVIQPLIKAIGQLLTKALIGLGVDEATAKKVGGILGAVVAAILIVVAAVAAFVVGRSAAANLLKHIGPMIEKLVKNLLPEVLKSVGKGVAQGVASATAKLGAAAAKTLGSTVDDLAVNLSRVTVATQAVQVANAVSQGAGAAVVADIRIGVAELQGELDLGIEFSRIMASMLDDAQDAYAKLNDLVMHQMEKLNEVIASSHSTGSAVVHNMRSSAA